MFDLAFEVFPYLAFFFLLDGLSWVRAHQVLFARPWRSRVIRRGPGIHFLGLLPTAELVVLGGPPAFVDTSGLHWLRSSRGRNEPGTWASVPHESIRAVTISGATLVVDADRHHEVACASPGRARHLRRSLEAVRTAAPNTRERLLEDLTREATDTLALRALRDQLRPVARWLRGLGVLLFVLLFLAVPACLYAPGQVLARGLVWVGPLVILVHVSLVVLAFRVLRHDGLDKRAAIETLAPVLLFPPGAVRALSVVCRDGYARFSAATGAVAWLPGTTLLRLARQEHFRLTRELLGAAGLESNHLRSEIDHWTRALARVGIDLTGHSPSHRFGHHGRRLLPPLLRRVPAELRGLQRLWRGPSALRSSHRKLGVGRPAPSVRAA